MLHGMKASFKRLGSCVKRIEVFLVIVEVFFVIVFGDASVLVTMNGP